MEAQSAESLPKLLSTAIPFLIILSALAGGILAFIARKFFTKTDPRVEEVTGHLAHAHCGACGFAGCSQYAEAVVNNPDVPPNLCPPAGPSAAEKIATLTGKTNSQSIKKIAVVRCTGDTGVASRRFLYHGVKDCRAVSVMGGDKDCSYGCLGYGTCVRSCPFNAMIMGSNGLPIIDSDTCVACGQCAIACPRTLIIIAAPRTVIVKCKSIDKGAEVRSYCKHGCIGCGKCAKTCPHEAITVANFLATIDPLKCTSCRACIAVCPTTAISEIICKEDATPVD